MKEGKWTIGFAVVLLMAMGGTVAVAGAGAPGEKDRFWPKSGFHNPTDWLSMGLDHRFRSVWGDNIDTLGDDKSEVPFQVNHEYEYQRYRTRWWTKWMLGDDVSFNTRLTWEFRTWDEPPRKPQDVDFDEALFDWLNIRVENVGGMPLTATVGRQDVILGVGWLVLDGTPLDGSRTIFMDAARFTYMLDEKDTKVDLIYIDQASESDRWLEPISDEDRALAKADERGAILYLTNKSFENTQLEGFFMYKNDNPVDVTFTEDPALPGLWSQKAEIYTFGAAIAGTEGEHWKYRAEGAMQTGNKTSNMPGMVGTEQDIWAFGVLTNLEYLFKDSANSSVHVGYEYASGDDPSTSDNEQFDLLWAEWPRWSELFIYSYTFETSIAESTNLHRANFGHKFNVNKQWQISLDYHALWADENSGSVIPGVLQVSNDEKFRGNLVTMWAKYKFNSQLSGHLLAEYFCPGDYYPKQNNDSAYFLRFNLELTF